MVYSYLQTVNLLYNCPPWGQMKVAVNSFDTCIFFFFWGGGAVGRVYNINFWLKNADCSIEIPNCKWLEFKVLYHISCIFNAGGGGGYLIYPWVGRCGTAPHTLTLFKTNIADFPTLFKTEFRFFNTLFKTFNPNINEQAKILLFIVQEKTSCLRQKLINQYHD